jgi:hypothetical protein
MKNEKAGCRIYFRAVIRLNLPEINSTSKRVRLSRINSLAFKGQGSQKNDAEIG